MSNKRIDTGNTQVRRNRKYEPIVDRLCNRKCAYSQKPIFQYIKDLMVFAAMVGYTVGVTEELEPDSIQIVLSTYASDEKDGFIYLIALLKEKTAAVLKDEKIAESVKYFERYCNGGLSIIQGWLEKNPGDSEGVDTLAHEIYEQILENNKVISGPDRPEVEF